MKQIPVQNIFHMLSYSWGSLESSGPGTFEIESARYPIDILARELCRACNPIIKRRTALEFKTETTNTDRPRGKINFSQSIRSANFGLKRLACESPIITADNLPNRLIKAALRLVRRNQALPIEVRDDAYTLESRLSLVVDVQLSQRLFKQLKLAPTPRSYRLPLAIAELLVTQFSPSDHSGSNWFEGFVRDEIKMRRLFESFVRALLREKLKTCSVGARRFPLSGLSEVSGERSLIPMLNADIVIESPSGRTCIIDAKFSLSATNLFMGKELLRSEHFYQILTYVTNYKVITPENEVSGIVLYPEVGRPLDTSFLYQGASFRFVTVDLTRRWDEIEKEIVDLCRQYDTIPKEIENENKGGTALPIILA
jgi:5-methylcytosine-specific restriction enzyme subunit McrC